MLEKIKANIKGTILLHEQFGVSYLQLLKSFLMKDKMITIRTGDLIITTKIRKALYIAKSLGNIEKYGWKIIGTTDDLMIFESEGIKLYSRLDDEAPYSSVINDVFIKETYRANVKDKVVIDVGAYRGESSIYFALQGAKKVIALEPDEENFKIALRNIKENGLENKITLLNKALAPNEGIINFYKYLHTSIANSTDPDNMDKLDDKIIIKQVEAITLRQIIEMAGEERIGLLKLDCEGCEYSALSSFSAFDRIDEIILEYHNGLQNLPDLLKSFGYELTIEKENKEKLGIIRARRV